MHAVIKQFQKQDQFYILIVNRYRFLVWLSALREFHANDFISFFTFTGQFSKIERPCIIYCKPTKFGARAPNHLTTNTDFMTDLGRVGAPE